MMNEAAGKPPWDDKDFDELIEGALAHWDLAAAVQSVRSMLHTLYSWRRELVATVKEPTITGPYAVDVLVQDMENLLYSEVASSQAAIASIASLFETLVHRATKKLHEHVKAERLHLKQGHPRTKRQGNGFWRLDGPSKGAKSEPAYSLPKVLVAFQEILEALETQDAKLPNSSLRLLEALYSYRDQMLHWAYEWPEEKRREFDELVREKNWQQWFTRCTKDGEPWMFSLENQFEEDALSELKALAEKLREIDKIVSAK